MSNEFSSIYNKKKDETYYCVDAAAREELNNVQYKITCVTILNQVVDMGTYYAYLLNRSNLLGHFNYHLNGSCIRAIFTNDLVFYNYPVKFRDGSTDYPVYFDANKTEGIGGWYKKGDVIDFVWNATDKYFTAVNLRKATTSQAGDVVLSSDTTSTSEATAATSLAVKTVRDMISSATGVDIQVVSTLPTVDISTHTIYLVPKQTAQTDNVYDEYINTDGTSAGWELLGDTAIDLSGYYTKTETDTLLGDKVDKVTGKGLSTEDYTSAEKTKLAGIATGAEVNVQADFSQTDNTADDYIKNKPTFAAVATSGEADDVSYDNTQSGATGGTVQAVIDGLVTLINNLGNSLANKVDKVTGKGLSTEDYTTAEKNKLSGIETGAEQNVQVDWSQNDTTADDYLKNKPTIPSALSDLSDDSTHRVVTDTEKSTWSGKVGDNPTFTEASTRANIASGESFATILGKIKKFFTDLKTVAFTGSYTDLTNQPTIPTVNDSTISFWYNQDSTQSFTLNQNSNKTINLNDHITTLVQGSNVQIVGASQSYNSMQYTISATDTKPRDGQFDNTPTPVSVPNSTDWSCIAPDDPICTAPAGSVWIVSVALQYPSNTSGFRSIAISTTNTGSTAPAAIMQKTVAPANGAATNLVFSTFVAPTTATTYYVWGRQNSGAARNVTYRYRAIRIL